MELRFASDGLTLVAVLVIAASSLIGLLALVIHAGSFLVHRPTRALTPASTLGTIARVTVPIPAGGVGAVRLVGTGTRVSVPARTDLPHEVPCDAEVVVLGTQDGVATVALLLTEE
ncbi:MAG: hypothetical protein KC933_28240 [Myxococcales bacterium]|nr:hypothetical protein [Myxococcales bacterium]MCB9651397.1 hypothetical protein [Deltaproteobacteria bacterium]